MAVLQSELVINADDRTAAAFASIESRMADLQAKVAQVDRGIAQVDARAPPAAALRVADRGAAIEDRGAAVAAQAEQIDNTMPMLASASASMLDSMLEFATIASGIAVTVEGVNEALSEVHEKARMEAAGLPPEEREKGEEIAAKEVAKYPEISRPEMMGMLRNLRERFGSFEEAAKLIDTMAQYRVVLQGAGASAADIDRDLGDLVKGLEIKGITEHPDQFKEYMQGMAKAVNAFGDTLKPEQFYEMFKAGRQAAPMLSEQFILETAPALAEPLGGTGFGRAMASFNAYLVGHQLGAPGGWGRLAELGLLPPEAQKVSKAGEVMGILPEGKIAGEAVAERDPNAWVRDYLVPAMAAHGITTPEAQEQEIAKIFPRFSAQMVQILATQQQRITEFAEKIAAAKGLEAAETFTKTDPRIAGQGLWNAIKGDIAGMIPSAAVAPVEVALTRILGFGHPDRSRAELMERYGQGEPTAIAESLKVSEYDLREARRVQDAMNADREAARGAALMAAPAPPAAPSMPSPPALSAGPAPSPSAAPSMPSPPSPSAAPDRHIMRGLEMIQSRGGEDVVDVVGHRREQDLAEASREASRGRALSALPGAPGGIVTISGSAAVEQTLHVDITLDPNLRADLDFFKNNFDFSVPLNSADSGRMDSDASPRRGPPDTGAQ